MVIRSYRSAFILVFAVMTVLTVLSVGSNAYRRASQISSSLSADIVAEMSEKIVNRTVRIFEVAHSYLDTDAVLFSVSGPTPSRDQVFRVFWNQLRHAPQLLSIYAADPSGSFLEVRMQPQLVTWLIERSDDRVVESLIYRNRDFEPIAHVKGDGLFDPRTRPWYDGAVAAGGEVFWSALYRFAATGRLGFTAAKAVYGEDGSPVAVVAVDIALESLSEFLAEQRDTRGAVALIVDRDDKLVTVPYRLALRKRSRGEDPNALYQVADLSDTWLVDAYRVLQAADRTAGDGSDLDTGPGMQDYEVTHSGGTRYIAYLHNFPAHWADGWKLFVVVPEASLLSAASRLLSESVVISVIILIIALSLVSLLAVRLFEPMHELVQNTELVKQLRLDEVQPVNSRFREIQAMDQAICSMRQGLQSLAKFVPAAVARDLIQSGKEARPGGELVEVTLFFSAMAEFESLCRSLPPEQIVAILSTLLDRFTRVVLRNQGNVDSYLGESIMAYWGAPLVVPDGPGRACRAALQSMRIEEELRAKDPDEFPVATRSIFAVHAGRAIVGNIGSAKQMSYTVIGDNVEIGWKLKRFNHRYGTRIIVSDSVRSAVAGQFWFRWLDVIPLHGSSKELAIFELLGEHGEPLATDMQAFVSRYERGLAALRAADWETALPLFDTLLAEYPEDRSVRLMAMRCKARDTCLCPRLTSSAAERDDESSARAL